MKSLIDYIKEGYNTSSKLHSVTNIPLSTLKRNLESLVTESRILREGNGPSTTYRILKPTPHPDEIFSKMMIYHQQKTMDKKYRTLSIQDKLDIVLQHYIDNFSGKVSDYDEQRHEKYILRAFIQLEQKIK